MADQFDPYREALIVEALGEGVTTLKTGDRVAYAGTIGAYAQANNVPADKLVKLPASVSDEDMALIAELLRAPVR